MTATATADSAPGKRILDLNELHTQAGLTIWHVEDHSLPIITIDFAFAGAGAVTDPKGKDGLGQLVSNTMDEGAGSRDANAFQTALQDHAIELSFQNGRDHFSGRLKTLVRHQDLAFELLTDALTSPRFEDEAVTRMKNANIMRIKSSLSDTDWQASRLMNDVLFGDHPYARNSGGTLSGLRAITADDMRDFVSTELTRDRLVIGIAGDVDADQAKKIVDGIFAGIKAIPRGDNEETRVLLQDPLRKGYKSDSPQSSVQMVWPTFPKSDPDYFSLRVLNHLLGAGGFSSYLMDEIREKKGLTYGIYSRLVHMDYADYLAIESAASPENISPMTQAVSEILDRLKNGDIDKELLEDAKTYLIGALPLRFSSTQSLSSTALHLQLDYLPIEYLDEWADRIKAVTVEDVRRVSRRVFSDNTPAVTVVAGAVPDDFDGDLVAVLPGVE